MGEAVRVGLNESRAVRVMPASQMAVALGRMQRANTARLDHDLAREVAQREGAKAVVDGEVTPLGQGFIVSVRLRDAATDDELASFRETADAPSELIPAIDRATRALRAKIGESLRGVRATPSLAQVTTASLPALRKYTEAFRAHVRQEYATAIPAYEEAIRLDSMFGIAYRQLAIVYGNQRARPERVAMLATRAYELRDRLPEIERLLVEATYHGAGSPFSDRSRVVAAYERVLEIDPEHASALNNFAVVLEARRNHARAESLLAKGRTLHPEISFFWSGLARAQQRLGRTDEALRSLGEYRQRFPDAPDIESTGLQILFARYGIDSLLAACQRAGRSRSNLSSRRGVNCLRNFSLARGQLDTYARLAARSTTLEYDAGNPWTRIGVLDSALVDIWFRERGAEAVQRLDQYVARTQLREAPGTEFLYFRIASLYAWAGRPDRARAILSRYTTEVRDTARLRIEVGTRTRTEGEVALAERRYDDAIRLIQKGDTAYDGFPSFCELCTLGSLALAYDLAGQRDSAIKAFERYVQHPFREGDQDGQYLAGAHKRLAELYDAAGNVSKAASHYAAFVDLWKDADPELQPKVAAARKRLAVLTAREGR